MKIIGLLIAAVALALVPATASAGGAEVITHDLTGEVIPAHPPCVTEDILILSGSALEISHVHVDGSDGIHDTVHLVDRGVRGVGVETGTRYQVSGVTVSRITEKKDRFDDYFLATFNFISVESGDNLVALVKFRFTVDGDGVEFTERIKIDCRG